MSQEKSAIIERIRKLLAMAGDAGSPNEAAIAARRARALMDKHQIDYEDVDNATDDGFNELNAGKVRSKIDIWQQTLAVAIAKMNDCIAAFDSVGYQKQIQFRGLSSDVELCKYLFDYLTDTAEAQYKTAAKVEGFKGRTLKNQFMKGFSAAIGQKVKEIMAERAELKTETGKSLIVVKSALVAQRYGKARYSSAKTYSKYDPDAGRAREAGQAAGFRTAVNQSVGMGA